MLLTMLCMLPLSELSLSLLLCSFLLPPLDQVFVHPHCLLELLLLLLSLLLVRACQFVTISQNLELEALLLIQGAPLVFLLFASLLLNLGVQATEVLVLRFCLSLLVELLSSCRVHDVGVQAKTTEWSQGWLLAELSCLRSQVRERLVEA